MRAAKLTVALFAQLTPREAGGIGEALQELVVQLGRLEGDEHYIVITSPEGAEWLRPHIGANQRLEVVAEHLSHTGPAWERRLAATIKQRAHRLVPTVERLRERIFLSVRSRLAQAPGPPVSDGTIESLGADVVHFPYQRFIQTALPSIFEPWDLQHRHLPEFFTFAERQARDELYRQACQQASTVIVTSDWLRNDLLAQFAVPVSKTALVRRGPLITMDARVSDLDIVEMRQRLSIPDEFILYPAHLWPHKNHVRLIETLAILRDSHDTRIHLVCTGGKRDYIRKVQTVVQALQLQDQVTFTGYVPQRDVSIFYRLAKLLIFPSLFEGYGFPLVEAMAMGVPIACSNVGPIPEIVGTAARLFDPWSVTSIAEAVLDLWRSPTTRAALVQKGRSRSSLFDSAGAAQTLRALYRELGGRELTGDDLDLLARARKRAAVK